MQNECTNAHNDDGKPWCATSPSFNGQVGKHEWGVCEKDCPGGGK